MAQHDEESRIPVLVAPLGEAVVDGRHVRFQWDPVKGATRYSLEISEEPAFDGVVHESKVGTRTEIVVEDVLPVDKRTYYWRVIVTDEDGVTHGHDNVESFISATRVDEDLHLAAPDDDEEQGPGARLIRGAAVEAAAHATHAPRYVEEEAEIGVQHEGIEAAQILGLILATAVALGLVIFTLFQYVDIVEQHARFAAAGASGNPKLREIEIHAVRRLTQYALVDGQADVYQIPIDRAIDMMANEARQSPADSYSSELNLLPGN